MLDNAMASDPERELRKFEPNLAAAFPGHKGDHAAFPLRSIASGALDLTFASRVCRSVGSEY
jgi:hypothetical protein